MDLDLKKKLKNIHICIVTPGQIGSNPRVVKEADALHSAGYAVTVISTYPSPRVEMRDTILLARIKWQSKRLNLRSRLIWKGRRIIQFVGRRLFKLTEDIRFAVCALSPYTSELNREALKCKADIYIAHYPAALPAVAAASQFHNAIYAYDAEDFHLGDLPDTPEQQLDRALVHAIEGKYLPDCDFVTAASPGIADAYVVAYNINRPTVILNTFPLAQAPSGPTTEGSATPGPSIYWFSQTIGPNRGLECAVEAIARTRSRPHLYLRGSLANGFGENLLQIAAQYGAEGRIHFLQPAPPDDLERLAVVYDLGLCAEPGHTANNQIALANKLFSYLLAGIPPLMSDTPAHKAFAREAGLEGHIYPIDDANELAKLIDDFLENPERLAATRLKAWNLAQERYNWEIESRPLQASVAQALSDFKR